MKNILLILLLLNPLRAIEIAEIPPQELKLVDIIPLLKEHLPNLFIDSSLYGVSVTPFNGKTEQEALLYCMGFALANDLKFVNKSGFVLIQANDIARVTTLESDIDQQTITSLKSLNWDFIPHRGKYIVEYPMGHEDIMETIKEQKNEEVTIQLVITTTSNEDLLNKGIALEQYLQGYINFFEFFTIKDVSKWETIRGGFKVDLDQKDIKQILTDTTTLKATSILGKETTNSIISRVPYETYQRDVNGFITSRDVQFIEAGLRIQTNSKKVEGQYLTNFQIEMSSI